MSLTPQKPKIAIVVCYFGSFPIYFDLTLDSMKKNTRIDWIFITDQLIQDLPSNIKCVNYTFLEFQSLIQSFFNFRISLDSPYKICDFRPAFGCIFESELNGYEFWGHCDLDMIFGDILSVVPDSAWKFDKVLIRGALGFYRNSSINNNVFRLKYVNSLDYETVFSSTQYFGFDEWHGIMKKFISSGIDFWDDQSSFYDINKNRFKLRALYSLRVGPVISDSGKVYMFDRKLGRMIEGSYIHLQKRKITLDSYVENNGPLTIKFNQISPIFGSRASLPVVIKALITFYYYRYLAMKRKVVYYFFPNLFKAKAKYFVSQAQWLGR